jgi:hypothetical protein
VLFGEDLGLVLEVATSDAPLVLAAYKAAGVSCVRLGATLQGDNVTVMRGDAVLLDSSCAELRDVWEATVWPDFFRVLVLGPPPRVIGWKFPT